MLVLPHLRLLKHHPHWSTMEAYVASGYYQISKGIKACATTTQLKRMFLLAGLIRAQKQSPELFLFSELTVREVDLIS